MNYHSNMPNTSPFRVRATLGVAWERQVGKQTLFAVWGEDQKEAHRGAPPTDTFFTLRATKGVNMNPSPVLQLVNDDGSQYLHEEEIRLSLVNSVDKQTPPAGSCPCKKEVPVLTESKEFNLIKRNDETFAKVRGGFLEFTKLQIGRAFVPIYTLT